MKLLVFAHTPPPHHGQSYMVQLMLGGLGGDRRRPGAGGDSGATGGSEPGDGRRPIECYHVNTRLSKQLEDIGDLRVGKLFLLFGYCLQAIWCRFRYGVTNFYYIPAPGKPSALYRDWLVMFLCRPFFKRVILHWHASGLARWLETTVQMRFRSVTYSLMKRVDLSIVLSQYGRRDAEKWFPQRIRVVANGIPDPCPNFSGDVLPRRRERLATRRRLAVNQESYPQMPTADEAQTQVVEVLFLAHCTRDKGLFDAVQGAQLAQEKLASRGSFISLELIVAGQFVRSDEEDEFRRLCSLCAPRTVRYVGFVSGEQKRRLFAQCDIFCFPSHLESFGLVLAEAMAFGLPIVTTRCGAVPEVMSLDYPGLVEPRAPGQIAEALLSVMFDDSFETLRRRFEAHFTLERYVANVSECLLSLDEPAACPSSQPAPARGHV